MPKAAPPKRAKTRKSPSKSVSSRRKTPSRLYKPEKVKSSQVLMTPEKASKLLSKNTHNRKLRRLTVQRYAHDMTNGNWKDFGATIQVDVNGIVLNGQHALNAIVESGMPQWVTLQENLCPTLIRAIDKHARRNWAEDAEIADRRLKWINGRGIKQLALPIANAGYMMCKQGYKDKNGVDLTDSDKVECLIKHKKAISFVDQHLPIPAVGGRASRVHFRPTAIMRAAIVRAWYTVEEDVLADFCQILRDGYLEKNPNNYPVKTVTWFREDFMNKAKLRNNGKSDIILGHGRAGMVALYAYAELTLNYFLEGKELKRRLNSKIILGQKRPMFLTKHDKFTLAEETN